MRLLIGWLLGAWAMPPKVLDSLQNLAQSLHDESQSTHFEKVKAGCDAEAARAAEEAGRLQEGLEVLKAETEESSARVEELDQQIIAKKLEVEQVNGQIQEQTDARKAARTRYEDEAKTLLAAKAELADSLAKHAEAQYADKSSLAQLRKLSRSLSAATRPSFLQLGAVRSPELEAEQAKLNKELDATRKAFDAQNDEFGTKLDELHAELAAQELDLAKLLPAKANAESRNSGGGARALDIERTLGKVAAAEEAHGNLCRQMLDELQASEEKRTGVEHDLASAVESLSSSVFTSLVERSAQALDMAPSFVQLKTRMLRTEMLTAMDLPGLVATAAAGLIQKSSKEVLRFVPQAVERAEAEARTFEGRIASPSFVQESLALRTGAETDPFLAVKQKIRMLIDSLRDSGNQDVDLIEWCKSEEENNARSIVKREQDNDMAQATALENKGREAELADQRKAVEEAERTFSAAGAAVTQLVQEHEFRMAEQRKAHELAAEVLTDAAKLVREFYGVAESQGSFLQQTPSEAGQKEAAERALQLLEAALQGVKELVHDAETGAPQVSDLQQAFAKQAGDLGRARSQELNSLEVMASGLADARLEAEQSRETGVAQVAQLKLEKDQVALECASPDTGEDAAARRQDEIAALKDAVKVLEGEDIPIAGLLQGARAASAGSETALDRAAAALGIRVRPQ